MGERDVAGGGAEAADQDGERLGAKRVGAGYRRLPERAGFGRIPVAAAEEAVDVGEAGPETTRSTEARP